MFVDFRAVPPNDQKKLCGRISYLIPGWLLKDNADLLTEPVTEILNTSYFENCLPSS